MLTINSTFAIKFPDTSILNFYKKQLRFQYIGYNTRFTGNSTHSAYGYAINIP